jgi:hypothetical protein
MANGAVKPVRVVHSKRLGLFRQPRTGSTLSVDGRSISPVNTGGDSSSDEGNSPSQPSTPTTPMENQNNPARPWLDQDVVAVPGA